VKDPTAVATKWHTNFSASGPSITAGVNAVTVAPGIKAAAKKALWLAKVTASVDKWARNVSAVPLATWQQAMLTTGLQRLQTGATAGQPKVAQFMGQFLPYLDRNKAVIDAMDTSSISAAIQKAAAQITYNAAFQYNRAGA
jgi:ABC-type Co2+ transport system permease subunit